MHHRECNRYNFDRKLVNLDNHQLVWCFEYVAGAATIQPSPAIDSLRKIVDYTKLFDDVDNCYQYLKQTSTTDTFLVISENCGEKLAPLIRDLKYIRAVYIYCGKRPDLQQSSFQPDFTKV